jgi:hypothetical protein
MFKSIVPLGVGVFLGYLFSDMIEELLNRSRSVDAPAETASVEYPALGTDLSAKRQAEINGSSTSNPVYITDEDIAAMDVYHVKVNLGSGRFRIGNPA